MIDKEQRITELTSLGLAVNEAKAYLALLVKNSMTVNEIAQISGVPRAKLYGVITKLITKGFCIEKAGDIKRYKAVDPNTVMDKLLKDYQEQIEQRKKIAKNFSDSIISIYQQNINKTDSLDYIQVLKEKNRIAETFNSLERKSKKEVQMFTKAPYAVHPSDNKDELDIIKRGVKVKSIYEIEETKKQDFLKLIEMYAETGEEVRVAYSLPLKLAIFDEKTVIFALRDIVTLESSITSVIVKHPDFAKAFKRIFDSYWQEAITLEEFKIKEKLL